jgi:hypothetical protein
MISSLIKSGGGTGPMKPGNRGHAAVPIPAGNNLADEARDALAIASSARKRLFYCRIYRNRWEAL